MWCKRSAFIELIAHELLMTCGDVFQFMIVVVDHFRTAPLMSVMLAKTNAYNLVDESSMIA